MPKYYEFEVSLLGIKPRIFRRFVLPASTSFEALHEAIQDAGGWEYSHLHSFFDERGEEFAVGSEVEDLEEGFGPKLPKDRRVKLYSYFAEGKSAKRCTYLYDYGDNWDHNVKLVRVFDDSKTFKRRLLDGARAFPPEDCGGTWGYEDCLKALSSKSKSAEMRERREWLGDWQPENFDLERMKRSFDR